MIHYCKKYSLNSDFMIDFVTAALAAGWELVFDFRNATAPVYAANTDYALGDIVSSSNASFNGTLFVCTGAGRTPASPSLPSSMFSTSTTGTASFFSVPKRGIVLRSRLSPAHPWLYFYLAQVGLTSADASGFISTALTGFDIASGVVFHGSPPLAFSTSYTKALTNSAYFTDIFVDKCFIYVMLRDLASLTSAYRTVFAFYPPYNLAGDICRTVGLTSPGSNVVMDVSDSSFFLPGYHYRAISADGLYREKFLVSAVPSPTSILISSLSGSFPDGSFVGSIPFIGVGSSNSSSTSYLLHCWDNPANTSIATGGSTPGSSGVTSCRFARAVDDALSAPYFSPLRQLCGAVVCTLDPITPIGAFNDDVLSSDFGTSGDVFGVGEFYRGSISSATASSITDLNGAFADNSLVGKRVAITSGTAAGQTRKIVSNTATVIVFDSTFPLSPVPAASSSYTICGRTYRKGQNSGALSNIAIMEDV